VKRRVLVLALGVAGAGCNYGQALVDYCQSSGACVCGESGCCVVAGNACDDNAPCCDRLSCAAGKCVAGGGPQLLVNPRAADLGKGIALGSTSAPARFSVTNVGPLPSTPLALALSGDAPDFLVDATTCVGRALAPAEACEFEVRANPQTRGDKALDVKLQESVEVAEVTVTYSTGYRLSVGVVGGAGGLESSPAGIRCPGTCSALFDPGTAIHLGVRLDAGTALARFNGGVCTGGQSCDFAIDSDTAIAAELTGWLHVHVTPVGMGSATATPGGGCTGDCAYVVAGPVAVVPQPATGNGLAAWGGGCADAGVDGCSLDVSGPTDVSLRFAAHNRVLTAAIPYLEQIGPDLAGADQACALAAQAAGVPGTFRAWLSTSTASAASRLAGARGWVRAGDGAPFADSVDALVAGQVFYPVSLPNTGPLAATGGTGAAVAASADTCGDWTTPSLMHRGGLTYAGTTTWASDPARAPRPCSDPAVVYCFGVDSSMPLRVQRSTAKRAFLSSPWAPDGGIAGADSHCAAEAAAYGLGSGFIAAVGPPAPGARLPWVTRQRLDGITFWDFVSEYAQVPVNVTADGGYVASDGGSDDPNLVWTGFRDAGSNCAAWTDASSTAVVGRPEVSGFESISFAKVPCSTARRLYCVEP